jgi:hypothetical protein
MNLSIQQIQKYEKATNRVASSRLYKLAKLLKIPVQSFFDFNKDSVQDDHVAPDRELLTLVNLYNKMKDKSLRKKALDLFETMSNL